MAREIPLTKGFVTIVDDDLFDWLNQWKWHAAGGQLVYAARVHFHEGVRTRFTMHRVIACAPPQLQVDHRNRNTLDNRRENLRLATFRDNAANCVKRSPARSGYRGVVQESQQTWAAKININGRSERLGLADTPEQAARLYDKVAVAMFGDFAVLNFPEDRGLIEPVLVTRTRLRHARSGFLGVTPQGRRWRAIYKGRAAPKFIGAFDTPEEAARAYDAHVRHHVGPDADLNFPDEVAA